MVARQILQRSLFLTDFLKCISFSSLLAKYGLYVSCHELLPSSSIDPTVAGIVGSRDTGTTPGKPKSLVSGSPTTFAIQQHTKFGNRKLFPGDSK